MSKPKLLLVDDDPGILRTLRWSFENYDVITASDRAEAVQAVRDYRPPVVTLDLGLPPDPDSPREGLEALAEILTLAPRAKVIVVTGQDERENAVEAIGLGAYDFYHKPIEAEVLSMIVGRAMQLAELEGENRRLKQNMATPLAGVVSASNVMLKLCRTIEKVAPTNSRVLISGPPGSGKEVAARLLHASSTRHTAPFVILPAASMEPDRVETELFGVESGGETEKIGLMERAHGGTLFIDEVADMPPTTQGKVLRVLTEQSFERVGGAQRVHVDVRVVSASSRDLRAEIERGRFREDLFHRLAVVPIRMPALTDRREDLPDLAAHFIQTLSVVNGKPPRRLSDAAIAALQTYNWPGNVRQLRNVIERLLIMAPDDAEVLDLDMLPEDLISGSSNLLRRDSDSGFMTAPLREAREAFEREYLKMQITRFSGNISKTANFIGMERSALHRKLKSLGLVGDSRRQASE